MQWDKDTQVDYIRAQVEYDVAWTKYYADICDTIRKYDGKKVTKRLGTALKKIDDRITFNIEKGYLNYINIGWYDHDGRIFKTKDGYDYLDTKEYGIKIAMYYANQDIDCLNADKLIAQITRNKDYILDKYNETVEALENIDTLKEEYDKAQTAFCKVMDKIPYNIRNYYGIDNTVNKWGYFRH